MNKKAKPFDGSAFHFALAQKILWIINEKPITNRPLIIGITGIDCSGKTEFTINIANYLHLKNYEIEIIHLDDYHFPEKVRSSGKNPVENYINQGFNFDLLIEQILLPVRKLEDGEVFEAKLLHLNLNSDKFDIEKSYSIKPETIVLLEGVFLFKPIIREYIDFLIFLDISFEECLNRAKKRDVDRFGKILLNKYSQKYIPAQQLYLTTYPVTQYADMVINNENWSKPHIIHPKLLNQ